MTYFRGEIISSENITRGLWIINPLSTSEDDAVVFMDDNNFFNALNDKFNVSRFGASKVRYGVTVESLSQKWLISLDT